MMRKLVLFAAMLPLGLPIAAFAQSQSAPPPPQQQTPQPGRQGRMAQRFATANTTGDGRLTYAQAQAGMPMVARHFSEIDNASRGYVTLDEIRAFAAAHRRAQNPAPVQSE